MEFGEPLEENEAGLDRLLAIQPVYARNLDVKAFELLLERTDSGNHTLDAMQAISQVVVDSYTTLYQNGRTQSLPCFLSLDEVALLDAELLTLPRQHFILEVPANIPASTEVCERLHELARKGYLLSLSGYGSDGQPDADAFLNIIHIVRLDIAALSRESLEKTLDRLKPYSLDLLADNLHGKEQFRFCLDAGFSYFRGEPLAKPRTIKRRRPQNNKLLLLQLLSEVEDPRTNLERLEEICLQDADLTYKFIKVINSAIYGMETEIETLSHALALLGTKQIRYWASMFLLEGHKDKPQDLVRTMLIRGRMCEALAEFAGYRNPVSHFIVGLLSKLDLLTDITMTELMDKVPLKKEIKDALLHGSGNMGRVLQDVENYEQGRFDQLVCLENRSAYESAYRHSTAWARKLQASLD
ncbi:MAG: HDOD domain-containing protein [Pseudohongiellaceae bacterium]